VDVHRSPVLGAKTLGNPEVITVPMGENQSFDIVEAPTHRLNFVDKLSPMTGKSAIDHSDARLVPEEIEGDDVRSHAMEVWGKFHPWLPRGRFQ
jgi:hypothetical protein